MLKMNKERQVKTFIWNDRMINQGNRGLEYLNDMINTSIDEKL